MDFKIAVVMFDGDTRNSFIPNDVAKKLETMGTVTWNALNRNYDADELREAVKDVDVCIAGWECSRFDEFVIKGAEKLKLIAYTGGSVAPIVSDFLYNRGIKVVSGNKIYAKSVAEGVIGYILASLRNIPGYCKDVQAGGWAGQNAFSEGLLDQTVGLVGFGAVARYLSVMLKAFNTRTLVYDPFVSDELCEEYGVERVNSLEEIVTVSKIISLHAPRTPQTYHIVDRKILCMIPDDSLLVNTARGSLIDEEALADELGKGRFKAVLDVYETEPLSSDSRLRGLDNVILMPHLAGPTLDRRRLVTLALIDEIHRFYNGQPLLHEIGREYAMAMTR